MKDSTGLFEFDKSQGVSLLCGVDEAGRGPLAGDVYAAAVILPGDCTIDGLDDSKKLSPKQRDAIYEQIKQKAVCYCVATASIAEIEEHNILNATFIAMNRAVSGLSVKPKLVLVDGNQNPHLTVHSRCVVKGDSVSASIAAASILAKVDRDRYMDGISLEYPQYRFDKHKGYGTSLHYEMLDKFGVSPVHRASFLKKYLSGEPTAASRKGQIGEETAVEYLRINGYDILFTNYHSAYGEVDIIASKGDVIAFVEVKARAEGTMVSAREAVSLSKQKKIIKTACCYLEENNIELQSRFDVFEVYFEGKKKPLVTQINHIENAFGAD